jgi:hypothetical protein
MRLMKHIILGIRKNNMKCKVCGRQFHYCTNCGYDKELHPLSEGYCSEKCLKKGNGPKYKED